MTHWVNKKGHLDDDIKSTSKCLFSHPAGALHEPHARSPTPMPVPQYSQVLTVAELIWLVVAFIIFSAEFANLSKNPPACLWAWGGAICCCGTACCGMLCCCIVCCGAATCSMTLFAREAPRPMPAPFLTPLKKLMSTSCPFHYPWLEPHSLQNLPVFRLPHVHCHGAAGAAEPHSLQNLP